VASGEIERGESPRPGKLLIPTGGSEEVHPHPGCPVQPFGMPTPTPRYFAKRGWICLIAKELTFLEATKRRQADENKGEVASGEMEPQRSPHPRAMRMVVKIKGLREKQFVSL